MRDEKKQIKRSTWFIGLAAVLFLSLSLIFTLTISKEQNKQTEKYLHEIAEQIKIVVVKQINGDLQLLQGLAAYAGQDEAVDIHQLLTVLEKENRGGRFLRVGFVDTDGVAHLVEHNGERYTRADLQDRSYVKRALNGEANVSEMLRDQLGTNELINCYAVPVYHSDQIIGVVYAANAPQTFRDILDTSIFKGEGFSFLVDHTGAMIVGSEHMNATQNLPNIFDATFITDAQKKALRTGLQAGDGGFFSYRSKSVARWATYVPVGINDWYVMSVVPKSAVNTNFSRIMRISAVVVVVVILFFGALVWYIYHIMRKSKADILRLAYYDSLTGANNKLRFSQEVSRILQGGDKSYAFVVLDISNFKFINELFGFAEGDRLLLHVSQVLGKFLDAEETYYRDSADRFGALMHMESPELFGARLQELMGEISGHTFHNGQQYDVVCNAGVKEAEPGQLDVDVMMDRAFLALGKSKGSHMNSCAFYDNDLHEKVVRRSMIENQMRTALEYHEFMVYLQPKYDLKTKQISGAEALVRWNSSEFGLIYPDHFIPVFEENGFITELDMYVLYKVCQFLRGWLDAGYEVFPISVNQSRLLFYKDNYLDRLQEILGGFAIPPELILLEITESVALEDMSVIKKVMNRLHTMGFSISMDDFGSGYSSLNVLQEIDIDELKLDKGFLNSGKNKAQTESIIKKIVELATELSIDTVAEGVETLEQAQFLERIGCCVAQGYYFARPMPVEQFEEIAFPQAGA